VKSFRQTLKTYFFPDREVTVECARINSRRILFGTPFVVVIHMALILVFFFNNTESDPVSSLWRMSLLITHSIMLAATLIAFFIAFYILKNNGAVKLMLFLQYYVMFIMVSGAIGIAAIDQLVTTNITAYTLINLAVAAFLLFHPLRSLLCYSLSFSAFFFIIAYNHPAAATLLSNRINGASAVALSFLLTLILWRQSYVTVTQRKRIDDQRKELEDANRKLEKMAFVDSLTGLSNRLHFDQVLQKEISLNWRKGCESHLIMLDIDHFKKINDAYGHPIGDTLLVEISRLLSDHIRAYDTLCRLGGEEFLVLLPQTSGEEAVAVAEKLRHMLETHTFCIQGHIIHITASFGVARLSYTSDPRLITQYAQVDNALYLAKQSGRNCVKTA
jgi:diguanylate cyclase (GGDEF)-like protein